MSSYKKCISLRSRKPQEDMPFSVNKTALGDEETSCREWDSAFQSGKPRNENLKPDSQPDSKSIDPFARKNTEKLHALKIKRFLGQKRVVLASSRPQLEASAFRWRQRVLLVQRVKHQLHVTVTEKGIFDRKKWKRHESLTEFVGCVVD